MKYSDPKLKINTTPEYYGIYRIAKRLPARDDNRYPNYKPQVMGGGPYYRELSAMFNCFIENLSEIDEIFNEDGKLMVVQSTSMFDEIVPLEKLKQLILAEGFLDVPCDDPRKDRAERINKVNAHIRARLNNC